MNHVDQLPDIITKEGTGGGSQSCVQFGMQEKILVWEDLIFQLNKDRLPGGL